MIKSFLNKNKTKKTSVISVSDIFKRERWRVGVDDGMRKSPANNKELSNKHASVCV